VNGNSIGLPGFPGNQRAAAGARGLTSLKRLRLREYGGTLSDQLVDPSGRTPTFDGAAWVSQDRNFWWNGTAWQPIVRPQRRPWGVIAIAIAIIAVAAFVIHSVPRQIVDTNTYGATNTVIDGPTQIEFDYRSQDSCSDLRFIYTFYNAEGVKLGDVPDPAGRSVSGGQLYHFTVALLRTVDPAASRFTATPNCSS